MGFLFSISGNQVSETKKRWRYIHLKYIDRLPDAVSTERIVAFIRQISSHLLISENTLCSVFT